MVLSKLQKPVIFILMLIFFVNLTIPINTYVSLDDNIL